VRIILSRRRFLQATGAAGVVVLLPAGCQGPPAPSTVLSDAEQKLLAALADAVLPPDAQPGGSALGAVDYVERLLGALEGPTPAVFAGGPYSGRQPFGDGLGGASARFPDNDFAVGAPLDRVSEATWQLRLYGGAGPNQAITGPVVGLRDQVRQILAEAARFAPAPPDQLDAAQRAALLAALDQSSIDTLVDLVSEAAFAAPEYGGNPDGAGWALCHFEGDSQPLGYSLFDLRTGTYRERSPVSTPAGSDPEPMDDDTREFVTLVVTFLGGEEFES